MTDPDPSRFRELMLDEEPGFEDVLTCVFTIRPHEIYLALLDRPGATAADLAEATDRDRSNVGHSLATLLDRGLATRRRHLLESGGQICRYEPTPREETRALMHETLDEWCAYVHARIDEFAE